MKWLYFLLFALITTVAFSQTVTNKPGLQCQGTCTPGHIVVFGATGNDAADGGVLGAPFAIGATVTGATPSMCLTVDANSKLAQVACLTAH